MLLGSKVAANIKYRTVPSAATPHVPLNVAVQTVTDFTLSATKLGREKDYTLAGMDVEDTKAWIEAIVQAQKVVRVLCCTLLYYFITSDPSSSCRKNGKWAGSRRTRRSTGALFKRGAAHVSATVWRIDPLQRAVLV